MMKKVVQTIALVMIAGGALAQASQKIIFLEVSDTLQQQSLEWADVDNDGALDILVFSANANGEAYIEAYRNEGFAFAFSAVYATQLTEAFFYLHDYDLDNRMDVVVSGIESGQGRTKVFINEGNFVFGETSIVEARGKTLGFADLNMDGRAELIMSDDSPNRIMIYQKQADVWNLLSDTLAFDATDLIFHDFNRDFYFDIFVSGRNGDGDPVQVILANKKGFAFVPLAESGNLSDAAVAAADVDADGYMDILFSGSDGTSQPSSRLVFGNGSLDPVVRDTTLVPGIVQSLFAADMTSDGQVDINVLFLEGGDVRNITYVSGLGETTLPSEDIVNQRFGDADGDGDLDLMVLTPGRITVYENTVSEINKGPLKPANAFATRIYDRLFIYWDPSGDDHTPPPSVTYDITLQRPDEEIIMGAFDLVKGKRTKVSHGNRSFDHFLLLKDVADGEYGFAVQSVDNAFHAGGENICEGVVGPGGPQSPCELITETLNVCTNEAVHLETEGASHWFSFADGYLGKSMTYTYDRQGGDTLFSVPASGAICGVLKVYNITRSEIGTRSEIDTTYACSGATLDFATDDTWDFITWSSSTKGFLSNEISIQYPVTVSDTVFLEASTATGCSLRKKTAIVISEPEELIGDTTYQILKGESVQLHGAVEGGISYSWEPPTSLDHSDIPNPIATPAVNTEYVVTIADSIGCTFTVRVMILVENTAFVPTLFTPNQDGTNDYLKVYGLGSVAKFSFRIYNREGNLVFRADDPAAATQVGWDGSVHGVIQPAGVYHWKIEGEDVNGKRVLLNGKETGSVVLIR